MKTESNFGLINQVKLNGIVGGGDALHNKKLMRSQNFIPSKIFTSKYNLRKDVVILNSNKANLKNDKLLEMGIIDKNSHKIFNQLINKNNKNIIKSINKINTFPVSFGSRIQCSRKIVKQHVVAAVAGGLIPSVAASAATLISNEIIMTSRIGYEYGYRDLKKQLKTVFKGAFEGGKTSIMTIPLADKASSVVVQQLAQIIQSSLTTTLAGTASKYIPFVGLAVNSTIAAFATEDLGDKIINYFEARADHPKNKTITYDSDSDSNAEKVDEKKTNQHQTIDDIDCLKYKSPEEYIEVVKKIWDHDFENSFEYTSAKKWVEFEETNPNECDDLDYCRAVSQLEMVISENVNAWNEKKEILLKKWEKQWIARLRLLEIIENNR